jgi:hypothetical protein
MNEDDVNRLRAAWPKKTIITCSPSVEKWGNVSNAGELLGFNSAAEYERSKVCEVVIIHRGEVSEPDFGMIVVAVIERVVNNATALVVQGKLADIAWVAGYRRGLGDRGCVLALQLWRGGCSLTHSGSRDARCSATRVAKFLSPLGCVVSGREVIAKAGPFVRSVSGGEYVLFAEAGADLRDMSGDDAVVAVDISAQTASIVPLFAKCDRLTFVRLPKTLKEIPARSFSRCGALVEVDLAPCLLLKAVGDSAFSGCNRLDHIDLPPSVRWIGPCAFQASGLRWVNSSAPSVTIGSAAFMGCTALATASFLRVHLDDFAFCGSAVLSRLVVEEVAECTPFALAASNISEISCARASELTEMAREVMAPPGTLSFTVEWTDAREHAKIVAMTNLTVLSGVCPIQAAERRLLAKIDLSALGGLPRGLTLQYCYFLEQVRLPVGLTATPALMFDCCLRLTQVNLGECSGLRKIGKWSFRHCWKLEALDVPDICASVPVAQSGVRLLDLRHGCRTAITADFCIHLNKLIAPHSFRGQLGTDCAVSLRWLTVADAHWSMSLQLRELRYLGARFRWGSRVTALSEARVLAEVAAVSGRPSSPILPR